MPEDVLADALEHREHLRPPRDVGMQTHHEDGVIQVLVDPVELLNPPVLRCRANS